MDYNVDGADMFLYATTAAEGTKVFLKTLYTQYSDAQLYDMIAVTPMMGQNGKLNASDVPSV